MVALDTMWLDTQPNLGTYFSSTYIDSMIQCIKDLRAGITPATQYFWKIPEDPPGTKCAVCPSWPLPEDFSYTDAQLLTAGNDGLPLGDLNWFPEQKAQWEANKAQHIATIEALAGPKIQLNAVGDYQAENGTLGSDATVRTFSGFAYYQFDAGGFIEWIFDLPTGGTFDLVINTHLRNNTTVQKFIRINGINIRNKEDKGEYLFDSAVIPKKNAWTTAMIKAGDLIEGAEALTMAAGQNVLRIEQSSGPQYIGDIYLESGGTRVDTLKITEVTASELVLEKGRNVAYVPVRFKDVKMNSSGSVSLNMDVPADGEYSLRIFYQNGGETQTAEIKVDGATVVSGLAMPGIADSTGLSVMTDAFNLTAGSHAINLAVNQVNVDYIQLIQKVIISSVNKRDGQANDFVLMQNYPNPFNPTTTIRYELASIGKIKLSVYDVLGREIKVLLDVRQAAGSYSVVWDGRDQHGRPVGSGVYLIKMVTDNNRSVKKMLLVK
jgi:hypothetical protein